MTTTNDQPPPEENPQPTPAPGPDPATQTPAGPSNPLDPNANTEDVFINRAAIGYTGGTTTPHDYESEDNHGMGFINPPPHMQETARTVGEQAEIAEEQNQVASVPADFGQKPAVEGQNIPGTPETAQEDVITADEEASRAEETSPTGPQMPSTPMSEEIRASQEGQRPENDLG